MSRACLGTEPQNPSRLFRFFDHDSQGLIDLEEFKTMLPQLGITIPAAKAIRVFRMLDASNTKALTEEQFKVAVFALNPASGGPLHIDSSELMGPREAFVLFDRDNSGAIDEDEFVWVLEFMGYDIKIEDEELVEKMFRKYDADSSGAIEYGEFRTAWLDLCDVREELKGRGITKFEEWTPRWKLVEMLDAELRRQDAQEQQVLAYARKWVAWQHTLKRRRRLLQAARRDACMWLQNALDAAGQVYTLGHGPSGTHDSSDLIQLLPVGGELVASLWLDRVDPAPGQDLQVAAKAATAHRLGRLRVQRREVESQKRAAEIELAAAPVSRKRDPSLPVRSGRPASPGHRRMGNRVFRAHGKFKRTDIRSTFRSPAGPEATRQPSRASEPVSSARSAGEQGRASQVAARHGTTVQWEAFDSHRGTGTPRAGVTSSSRSQARGAPTATAVSSVATKLVKPSAGSDRMSGGKEIRDSDQESTSTEDASADGSDSSDTREGEGREDDGDGDDESEDDDVDDSESSSDSDGSSSESSHESEQSGPQELTRDGAGDPTAHSVRGQPRMAREDRKTTSVGALGAGDRLPGRIDGDASEAVAATGTIELDDDVHPDEALHGEPPVDPTSRRPQAASPANPFWGVRVCSSTLPLWGQGVDRAWVGATVSLASDPLGRLFAWGALRVPDADGQLRTSESSELVFCALGIPPADLVSPTARHASVAGPWALAGTTSFVRRVTHSSLGPPVGRGGTMGPAPASRDAAKAHRGLLARLLGRPGEGAGREQGSEPPGSPARRPPARMSSRPARAVRSLLAATGVVSMAPLPAAHAIGSAGADPTALIPVAEASHQVPAVTFPSLLAIQRRHQAVFVLRALDGLRLEVPVSLRRAVESGDASATPGLVALEVIDHSLVGELLALRGFEVAELTRAQALETLGQCFSIELSSLGSAGALELRAAETKVRSFLDDDKEDDARVEAEKIKRVWALLRPRWRAALDAPMQEFHSKYERTLQQLNASYAARQVMDDTSSGDQRVCLSLDSSILAVDCVPIDSAASVAQNLADLAPPRWTAGARPALVAVGDKHLLFVLKDGSVYTCGAGTSGRLGLGCIPGTTRVVTRDTVARAVGTADRALLTRVEALATSHIVDVSAGFSHSAAVSANGKLWLWGSSSLGKLGVGKLPPDTEDAAVWPAPVHFASGVRVKQVSCGHSHTACVSHGGQLFVWGATANGRLGIDIARSGKFHEPVHAWIATPTLVSRFVEDSMRVDVVASGSAHTMALVHGGVPPIQGQVFVAGAASACGSSGRLFDRVGGGLASKQVARIAAGTLHCCAVTDEGELYTWGTDTNGSLGHPVQVEGRRIVPNPTLVECLFMQPGNLCHDPCVAATQSSTFNHAAASRVLNGETDGLGVLRVSHTRDEECPWLDIDLGRTCHVSRISVWNRADSPGGAMLPADTFVKRLYPAWVMVSKIPFPAGFGRPSLEAAIRSATFTYQLLRPAISHQWDLPWQTQCRYVRIQIARKSSLHLAEVEVFGTASETPRLARVVDVTATDRTLAVLGRSTPEELEWAYCKAVASDPGNALILRELPPFRSLFQSIGYSVPEEHACENFEACLAEAALGDKGRRMDLRTMWELLMAEKPRQSSNPGSED